MKYVIPVLALLYIIWPADLVPDVVPVIGWIDDLVAFLIGLSTFLKSRHMGS